MARRPGRSGGALGALDFLGDVAEGVGGGLQAAGSIVGGALSGLGSAIGGALQGALTEGDKTIVNMGIVGEAGRQNVQSPKAIATPPPASERAAAGPSADENMPTKRLLVIALKYLSSIDSTLKSQLDFDVKLARNEAAAEREQQIETAGISSGTFGRIGDATGVTRQSGSSQSKLVSTLLTAFKAALGGAAFFTIMGMDQSQFDALERNIAEFKQKYGWIVEVAAAGGLIKWIMTGRFRILKALGLGAFFANDEVTYDENGNPVREQPSVFETALGLGLGGAFAYDAFKRVRGNVRDVRRARTRMARIRNAPRAAPSLRGSGFRDPRTGRTVSRAAVTAGGGWLSGPKGQRFVAFLSRRFGRTYVARKVMPFLARAFAGVAITATGVGAIPGILWTLVNIGLSAWTVYEILDAWWDFQEEEETRQDADAANVTPQPEQDASREDGSPVTPSTRASPSRQIVTRSETGRPEEAQAFFESKGWTPEQAAGIVGNLFVESGLRTDAEGDGGQAYGIAQWHPDRQNTFKQVFGKDIRESTFQEQLEFVNWELNNTEARAGNLLRSATDAETAAAIVDEKYERSAGIHRAERMANAAAITRGEYADLQGGGGGGMGQSIMDAVTGFTTAGVTALVSGLKDYIATDTTFDPTPGMDQARLPSSVPQSSPSSAERLSVADSERVTRLAREQVQMEANEIAGMREQADLARGQTATNASTASTIETAVRNANGGSLDVMNPNYKVNDASILTTYMMFFGVGARAQ